MFSVYILKSLSNPDKSYVGLTIKNPGERLREHNCGLSKFTKTDRPWILVYFENFYCKLCADKREQFLKSGVGYRLRRIIIKHYEELSSALQNGE